MKKGITVTSGAITGRVVFDAAGEDESKRRIEGGAQLSDAERALIMAEKTNSDAILQIGQWTWGTTAEPSRYFILDPARSEQAFAEVPKDQFEQWRGIKYCFSSQPLDFIGRLTDVKSGQVIAAYKVRTYANWHLPSQYVSTIYYKKGVYRVGQETFQYTNGSWITTASDRAATTVIELVARSFTAIP